ncbi:hypothetical protein SKAU_G00284290 [Synaphobranchus kaupii]|uniref:Uncharacterized protein n=1 Tax=Synaphobranchus kaupii TaxID=118154 RepID=A0A9Q1EXM8_SYNKA|nr:hypothetical protein SKAU_G00284290 [Synaphobranchus kaupii]
MWSDESRFTLFQSYGRIRLPLRLSMRGDRTPQVVSDAGQLQRLHTDPGILRRCDLRRGDTGQAGPAHVIQFLTGVIKTNQICSRLGVCKTQSHGMEQEVLPNYIAEFRISPGPGTMTELLDLLLSWITPENVCSLLQLCLFQDHASQTATPVRCWRFLARFHLGSNATELQTSAFLESVCFLHPSSIPKCDSFTQRYGALLQKALTRPVGVQEQCEVW